MRAMTFGIAAVMLAITAGQANAAVILYGSRAGFDLAHPSAAFEDFEAANVADFSVAAMAGPLDSTTNNAIFSAGDIVAGLRISTGIPVLTGDPVNMIISGPGFATYVSHAVSYRFSTTSSPEITVDFLNGNVRAFGLDLTSNPNGRTVTVNAFSGASLVGSFQVVNVQGAGTFFGLFDDAGVITRLELTGSADFFGVDNIAFSSMPPVAPTVPEPTSLVLAGFAGLGMAAGAWRRRRQEKQAA